jgi:hypothetical protein
MDTSLLVAIVGVAGAAMGSLITGGFTYAASARRDKSEFLRRHLRTTARDVIAFCHLEEKYTTALESSDRSAHSCKLEMRKKLRQDDLWSPSEDATVAKMERLIQELE